MVITFVLTPWSHYNTIIEPRARFLLSLMEDLSVDFPSHMIKSMIDIYRDITRDKFIFPSTITCILAHVHVTISFSTPFYAMGAISKESIQKSDAQLAAKWPRVESTLTNVAPTSKPSSSFAPPSSFGAGFSLATIMDQLQLMHVEFGSRLDHLPDEMCQMNTRISRIVRRQSRLSGFVPSPTPEPAEESSLDGGDDASGSSSDVGMTTSQ